MNKFKQSKLTKSEYIKLESHISKVELQDNILNLFLSFKRCTFFSNFLDYQENQV